MKTILPSLIIMIFLSKISAQHGPDSIHQDKVSLQSDYTVIAMEYIHAHLDEWNLSEQDISDMTISKQYTDKTTGITRIYFVQRYDGIPVYNAILNLNVTKEGEVFFAGNRFIPSLADKVNTTRQSLDPSQAIIQLAAHHDLPNSEFKLKRNTAHSEWIYDKGDIAKEDIVVRLSYQLHEDEVRLAWDVLFAPAGSHDKWSAKVDAVNGAVLTEYNWTVSCPMDGYSFDGHEDVGHVEQLDDYPTSLTKTITGPQYNVWPAPTESPGHGPRTIVSNPSDALASPYGWHDVDGVPGADFTITRGNNVSAFQDRLNLGYSSNDEPDGGPELNFDFPFHASWQPEDYVDASVVNFFYWVNHMHDFSYRFGFDEAAGNFQKNNYQRGGLANDQIYAVAQAAADAGFSNFPFYRHGNDGASGVIYMMEFFRVKKALTVLAPSVISGQYVTAIPDVGWGAGAYITNIPVTGEVVIVNDGVEEPSSTDGCEDIINSNELAGKIALVDRGGCEMGFKALQAQNAGAIGLIACNFDNEGFNYILPGTYGASVNIPVVFITASYGQILRQYAGNGLQVSFVYSGQNGPDAYDIGLDNGLIAHEYGHGITWRLSGGPDAACIENPEQMDEGWSDFFALITTVRPGDSGTQRRGIGSYLLDEPTTGRGSRRYPYSTDMNVSPLTYGDIAAGQERHDVGEVWCNMMWDMYWAFVDQYGWSADPYDEASGNHKAIRLAFEGLKNLPCHPGFVDGRDAILAADQVLYDGEHLCMLWEVFARRGLGYSAVQGSPWNAGDQTEAFDLVPECTNALLIEKEVTDLIHAGDEIHVTIRVRNFKQAAVTNVNITDEIPEGTTFKSNSSSFPATIYGSTISFQLGSMQYQQEATITYILNTDPLKWSGRKFLDEVTPASSEKWHTYTIGVPAPNTWAISDQYPAHSGDFAWHTKEYNGESRQALELNPSAFSFYVDGERPVLRFYHRYETRSGISGGIVDVREVGTPTWYRVNDDMIRHGYSGVISYRTFSIANLHAFSGNSGNDYVASYVDLSDWMGKQIQIRFRFGTSDESEENMGWLIDDIEFMDMLAYNGEVCVTSDQGDQECTLAPEAGTIVESKSDPTSGSDDLSGNTVRIFPNPALDHVTIALSVPHEQEVNIGLLTIDGKSMFESSLTASDETVVNIDTHDVPPGLYLVKVRTTQGQIVEKLLISTVK